MRTLVMAVRISTRANILREESAEKPVLNMVQDLFR